MIIYPDHKLIGLLYYFKMKTWRGYILISTDNIQSNVKKYMETGFIQNGNQFKTKRNKRDRDRLY